MKKLLFLAGVLLAGCRSEQVAFQFQPVASAAVVTPAAPAPRALAAAAPLASPTVIAPTQPAGARQSRRALALANKLTNKILSANTESSPAGAKGVILATHKLPLLPRLALRHRASHGAAESGLGNIGLFFIAVLLGILAGLAAIVNVIFGVGFFTALGYTAAGLVVLFLLYSLLSGGKKKAAKPAK